MTAVSKNANTAPNREYALRSLAVASGFATFHLRYRYGETSQPRETSCLFLYGNP
jgi:hypothetical protein